jgi:assimilatory nitrate reductase catalytic subunit
MTEKHNFSFTKWLSDLFTKQTAEVVEPAAPVIPEVMEVPEIMAMDDLSTVCFCFNVDEDTIKAAIKEQKLSSIEEIGLCLEAGTHCGSCHPRIQTILAGNDSA